MRTTTRYRLPILASAFLVALSSCSESSHQPAGAAGSAGSDASAGSGGSGGSGSSAGSGGSGGSSGGGTGGGGPIQPADGGPDTELPAWEAGAAWVPLPDKDALIRACVIASSCGQNNAMGADNSTPGNCLRYASMMVDLEPGLADRGMLDLLMKCATSADCAAFRSCFGGDGLLMCGTVSVCPNCPALSCNGDSIETDNGLSFNCSALAGHTCTPGTMELVCCARAACAWSTAETPHCVSETQGFVCSVANAYIGFDCAATNRVCVDGVGCVGTGADCTSNSSTCSGSVVTWCSGGKTASFDCADTRFQTRCAVTEGLCAADGTECEGYQGECDGTKLLICADGHKKPIDCVELGFETCVVPDGGGYARCAHSP